MKKFTLFVFLGLGIVSCNKPDGHGNGPGPNVTDYHQTAVTKFVSIGKTNLAYRVLGNKPGIPIILIASLGSTMDDWDPAITNGLAQEYKVFIFDLPGVGSSGGTTTPNIADMSKSVVQFISALGYTKVNLLGFSMGSFIGQQIVLTNPSLVNKIILTGTGPKGAEGLSNLPNLLASTAGLSPEQFFLVSHFTTSQASQNAGKLSWQRMQRRTVNRDKPITNESLTAELYAVLGWAQPYPDAFNELKTIKKPVLIVQGQADSLVAVVNAVRMSQNIPGAKLIVYPDAGHGSFYQYHREFIRSALNFLKK